MKHLKYGVSFVSVAIALVVASFGGGLNGLHW
jgi:hypothetical protein